MIIRKYQYCDCKEITELFYNTVHTVNSKDYMKEQLSAWATGYLDRLYVHKDFQRKGIATALCEELERAVSCKITTHASITAKPFFENRGYKVITEQQVNRQNVLLTNFIMEKVR